MNIKDYWTQPKLVKDQMIVASQPPPSYLRPKDCTCKVGDPEQCWYKKHGYRPGACSCACHYTLGVFD